MTAIAAPPPAAPTATPLLALDAHTGPLAQISADLLPDEVRAQRRLGHLKRRLVFGFVALALVIGLGYTLARQQTAKADDALAAANQRNGALSEQVTRYAGVTGAQADTQQITALLTQAMAGDVPWAKLVATLQRLAPRGVTLTGVNAAAGAGGASSAATPVPATGTASAPTVVGTLSLEGQAGDYRSIAGYVGTLASVKGLTGVTPATSTTGTTSRAVTFTITASLTTAAQGGRFTPTRATGSAAPVAAATNAPIASSNAAATPPAAPSTAPAQVGN